jgi:hypothetical protein
MDADGVLRALTSTRMAEAFALESSNSQRAVRFRTVPEIFLQLEVFSNCRGSSLESRLGTGRNYRTAHALASGSDGGETMKKTLAVLAAIATVGATAMASPAEARRGIWPGLAFGLAAGAITAGAIAASHPYYYGPGYYGYGPTYYGPDSYAYYGGPVYYGHRHWHRW